MLAADHLIGHISSNPLLARPLDVEHPTWPVDGSVVMSPLLHDDVPGVCCETFWLVGESAGAAAGPHEPQWHS